MLNSKSQRFSPRSLFVTLALTHLGLWADFVNCIRSMCFYFWVWFFFFLHTDIELFHLLEIFILSIELSWHLCWKLVDKYKNRPYSDLLIYVLTPTPQCLGNSFIVSVESGSVNSLCSLFSRPLFHQPLSHSHSQKSFLPTTLLKVYMMSQFRDG